MAFAHKAFFLAAFCVFALASAAPMGKAIPAAEVPVNPAAESCKAHLDTAAKQFAAGGIAAVEQVLGANESNYRLSSRTSSYMRGCDIASGPVLARHTALTRTNNTTPHAETLADKGLMHDVKASRFNMLGRGQWLPDDREFKLPNSSLPGPEAICGVNSLHPTNYPQDCRLVITWKTGATGVCSGWIARRRVMATAGHCVNNALVGGWAAQIALYCGGGVVCGTAAVMTTNARWLATTGNWFTGSGPSSNPYDMGAFLTCGSSVYSDGKVVGVLAAGIDDPSDHPCQNYAVAISSSGDGASNGNGGGAWLGRLIETVEGADTPLVQ
ncbi:hypothetical protein WJX81_007281 [Elliptochloris bilobata]|uniref:Serine protease n=1 Tax=Elliptochloris bilobata TaxID=381761 RepID=A0AAW1SKE9_9CHLO